MPEHFFPDSRNCARPVMTPRLRKLEIGKAEVVYFAARDPTPATTETKGNVTINRPEIPGTPEYFEVAFPLTVSFANGEAETGCFLRLNALVSGEGKDSPYSKIEAIAALQIAPMLRAL